MWPRRKGKGALSSQRARVERGREWSYLCKAALERFIWLVSAPSYPTLARQWSDHDEGRHVSRRIC